YKNDKIIEAAKEGKTSLLPVIERGTVFRYRCHSEKGTALRHLVVTKKNKTTFVASPIVVIRPPMLICFLLNTSIVGDALMHDLVMIVSEYYGAIDDAGSAKEKKTFPWKVKTKE